ncbi:MAG: PF20097 family protein [Patescibacteria group bacterium]
MEETKKCPTCDIQMEMGRMLNNAMVWTGSTSFKDSKEFYDTCVKGCEAHPAYGVAAYRCPTCNIIELYTVENEKA